MTSKAPQPKAVSLDETPQKRKSVFVVSPIGAPGTEIHRKASYALKYIFREALTADEWDVHRADEGESPDSIGQHVIRKLWEADLVIADLTGHNPNVFYELAIAHGWRKPVVHLIAKGETVPFDIVDQRTIFYDITDLASVESSVGLLRKYAEYAMAHTAELINPLTSFEKFSHIRADDADGGVAVAEVLEEVVSRLSRLEHRIVSRDYGARPGPDRRPSWQSLPIDEVVDEYASLLQFAAAQRGEGSEKADEIVHEQLKKRMEAVLRPFPSSIRGHIREAALLRAEEDTEPAE